MFAYMMRLAYVEEEETLIMSRIIRCTTRWNWCSAFNSSGGNNGQILASAVVKGTDWRINLVCALWWWGDRNTWRKPAQARGEHANSLTSWHIANCRPSQQLTRNFKDINVVTVTVFHKITLDTLIFWALTLWTGPPMPPLVICLLVSKFLHHLEILPIPELCTTKSKSLCKSIDNHKKWSWWNIEMMS